MSREIERKVCGLFDLYSMIYNARKRDFLINHIIIFCGLCNIMAYMIKTYTHMHFILKRTFLSFTGTNFL